MSTARAALVLAKHLQAKQGGEIRDHLCSYIGTTGGDHIFRDKNRRLWAVDLVVNSCLLCVGLPPSQWKHPPRLAA